MDELGDLLKEMQDAYSDGLSAMGQVGKEAAKNINGDHEIHVNINLSAKIESHNYYVDASIIFLIELEPLIAAAAGPGQDISKMLSGLGLDMGDNEDAVINQLSQPRSVGIVKKINLKNLELYDGNGKINTDLNKDAAMVATLKDNNLMLNFEGLFTYPEYTNAFISIPSTEKMHQNISFDIDDLEKPVKFSWTEKDKDNLRVKGSAKIIYLE